MTDAEATGTLILATLAARARDAHVDDDILAQVAAAATVLLAPFESYLAERDAR